MLVWLPKDRDRSATGDLPVVARLGISSPDTETVRDRREIEYMR